MVRVVVGLEGGEKPLAETVALLLRRHDAGRRGSAVEVVDVAVARC